MSTADLELFGPPDADGDTYPRFTTVLRGFDPEQVRSYVLELAARVEALDHELGDMQGQRDQARRRYQMARDDAYGQLASRMADVLKVADQQADRIRKDAEDESRHRVAEARQLAIQIQREAEGEAERLRQQSVDILRQAEADRDRIMGGLAASRDATIAEMLATRDHMTSVIQQLEVAVAVAESARAADEIAAGVESGGADGNGDPLADDLLGRTEGFEIMLPEFMAHEDVDLGLVVEPVVIEGIGSATPEAGPEPDPEREPAEPGTDSP